MPSNNFLFKIRLALVCGCVFVVGVGIASYASISSLVNSGQSRLRSEIGLSLFQSTTVASKKVEAALRQYLVSGSSADLREFEMARNEVFDKSRQLKQSARMPEIDALEAIYVARRALGLRAIEARNTSGVEAAMAILNSEAFLSLRVKTDSLLEDARRREGLLLANAEAAAESSASRAQTLIISIGFLFLCMLTWMVYVITHYEKSRALLNAKLRDSEVLSRSITDGMVEGVITMDERNIVVEVNQSALQLFALPKAEMVGRHFSKLLAQKSNDLSYFNAAAHDASPAEVLKLANHEILCRRKDGTEFLAAMAISKIVVSGRTILTVLVHDITDRKKAAEALKASEFLLSQITDTVPALLAYLDKAERFQFHNKAYEDIFGLGFGQIRGQRLEEVLGHNAYAGIREKVEEVLQGYVVRYERVQLTPRGGLRTYVMEYLPRYGDDADEGEVVGFFSIGTDITEFKRIDQMKTEFISTVSHELRTPLTSIRGSLGLLAGGVVGELPDAMKSLVQIAKNNCERLIRLINDILDSEKIESGKMQLNLEVLDLRKVAEQSLADNQGFALQHQVKLLLRAGEDSFICRVDPDRLAQVLTNLISNAVKFSPHGESVELRLLRSADSLRVEVADRGPGIPEEFRNRIFQKFSQADSSDSRQKAGTGLGLNISRAIIEKMGGKIGFTTVPNAGSVFFIELPEWREEPGQPGCANVPCTAARPRILICEDDPDVATLIGMMLDKSGFETDTSYSAEHAIQKLAASRYDAMTVDLKLPGENGLALIARVRSEEKTSDLPIVVISASASASASASEGEPESNQKPLSISDWLEKPIDEKTLASSVRRAAASLKSAKLRILHVEDDPDIRHVVSEIGREVALFESATSLQEARMKLRGEKFDLVLLDLALGTESGWDLIAEIHSLDPRPPVIVFSASDVDPGEPRQAEIVLIKSSTSNLELLTAIQRITGRA